MNFEYSKFPGRVKLNRKLIYNAESPLVTIITPYYNKSELLPITANSVFNQTFPFFEWIIVNDGSTEDISILKTLEKQDARIKVLHKENGGISTARNMAIKNARTDFIVSLDADDMIDPTFIECCYFALMTNPSASWCYTDSVGFGSVEYLWKRPFDSELMKKQNILIEVAMIRKAALLDVGCYDESEKHLYEDWHLWLKLMGLGKYPIHLSYYGSWYRRSDSGVLGLLHVHPDKHERAMDLINKAVQKIISPVKAIEFPNLDTNYLTPPKEWEWNRESILDNSKIKVLMLIPWLNMGGSDKFNLDIVSKCDKERFEFSLITTVPCDEVWRQNFEEHVTDIFDLTAFLETKDWASFIHYFIKSRNIDVIFVSNSYYGYYILPWLRHKFPEIAIIDYVHMEEWYWKAGGYARTSSVMQDFINKTYVTSNHLKNVMIHDFNCSPEKMDVLYINVDEKTDFNPRLTDIGIIRREVNVNLTDPVILFPCRIHPQKRPFLMLKIAQGMKKQMPNVRFFVVGTGHDLNNLIEEAQALGLEQTVYFFGHRNDLKNFYRDSNLTLICSIKEGISLTSYESLSMGVPVISADVGGQKELINDRVGRLIPLLQHEVTDFSSNSYNQDEVNLYVKAMCDILSDNTLYNDLCWNARKQIEEHFSMNQMIKNLETIFVELKDKPVRCNNYNIPLRVFADYLNIYNELVGREWFLERNCVSNKEIEERDNVIKELKDWIAELEGGKDWLEGKCKECIEQLHSKEKIIEDMRSWTNELQDAKDWLEEKLNEANNLIKNLTLEKEAE
ncbi:glycosyltransferase [Paenibacillus oleatilyticus]|uniref:Glycosyltransferase n=1 Tax=Paenibacillus oleatilyticus TaxID=2594886 RepID=A0ABV4V4X6_9BACL